ncbi:MAG: nuclear transport factor 2 family protein [Proteobacteria bacterium]|nr:nuclear transport factor 2 family protein [Pseudomonadota bacterium]
MDDPIEVVRQVVAADNGRDIAAYRRLLHDDYTAEVNGTVTHATGDLEAEALQRYWQAIPDGRIAEKQIREDRGTVTLRYRLQGTPPGGGAPLDLAGCTILEVEQGRVRRVYRYIDGGRLRGETPADAPGENP